MTNGGTSIPEVQRLLASLVASKPSGRIAEVGTAFGVGTRAMADALGPGATLVSVELDEERLNQARQLLAGTSVELVLGRWEEVLPERGPFDLIFFDGGVSETGLAEVIGMLAPGGVLIKDDLTPERPVEGDMVREKMLRDERLQSIEIYTTSDTAAIIATRKAPAVFSAR